VTDEEAKTARATFMPSPMTLSYFTSKARILNLRGIHLKGTALGMTLASLTNNIQG